MSAPLTPEEFFLSNDWEPEAVPLSDMRRAERMKHATHFETATIAHVLAREADKFVGSDTLVSIVGNDLPNVTKEEYPWSDTLRKWLGRGATVRYFAIEPTEKALAKLREISTDAAPGALQVRRLNRDSLENRGARKLATLWKTHHFVVFEDPQNPQFWVETFHPASFTEAKDCFYFGPKHASDEPQFALCRDEFEFMYQKHGTVLI